jgi:hypothetical protein
MKSSHGFFFFKKNTLNCLNITILCYKKFRVHLVEKRVPPIEEDRSIKGGGLEAEKATQPVSIFVRNEVSFC